MQFVEYLKTRNDFDVIIEWLKNEIRWDTYNFLLEITVNFLKENNFDFLENLSDITIMMLNQTFNNVITQEPEKEIELPTIRMEEFDNLFSEFLGYINAPIRWNQLYDELKHSGRISFGKQVDDLDTSMCYRDDNDILRILVSTDDTIKCFCTFVHEFIHYVTMIDSVTLAQFSISEFPSIFFEKISSQFLKDKGYKEEVINKIVNDRNKNNKEIYIEISSLFNDISVEVDKECDLMIENFIQNGLLVINGYQYLLDTFLAEEVLKQTTTDSTIMTKMIKVTNELGNINLQNILDLFNMQNILNKNNSTNKETDGNALSKKLIK